MIERQYFSGMSRSTLYVTCKNKVSVILFAIGIFG
ncbi:Uncharacterised protein [Mycolicibacterium flavescens]|nr:Uncharacterised protein [Mycolicibacterium flavescens]